jgi:hypothetical protein
VQLATGVEVARVFHGLASSPHDAMRSNAFWKKGQHIEYESLVELANKMILERREK